MKDYTKHLIIGAFVASFVAIPVYAECSNLFAGIWAAVLTAAFVGAAKEFGDCQNELNKFDLVDLGWTALGAIIPVLFIIGLHFGKG